MRDVSGIVFKDGDKWVKTAPREEISDLDTIPFPDYEGFGMDEYLKRPPLSILNAYKERTFFIIGSRNCPYLCTFCFHTLGRKYRKRSIENIIAEMEFLHERYDIKFICMSDECFAIDLERVRAVAAVAKRLNIEWLCNTRVDSINNEIIDIAKNGNCAAIMLGLESADNRILKSMKKNITIEQIEFALSSLYKTGIPSGGNLIFGDTEETFETASNTLDWWEAHKQYDIALNFIIIYPGTQLYKQAVEDGKIKDPVQFLKDGCPQINVSKMSDDEFGQIAKRILKLQNDENIEPLEYRMLSYDDTGRISIKGRCVRCGLENNWNNAKLLCGNNWINCPSCGQRHYTPFPKMFKDNLFKNLSEVLRAGKPIGLWGITKDSVGIFEEDFFCDERFVFIDNAYAKLLMKFHGRKVLSPDEVFNDEAYKGIDIVFFYPNSYALMSEQVERKYPDVGRFINIYEVIN